MIRWIQNEIHQTKRLKSTVLVQYSIVTPYSVPTIGYT